MKNGFSGIPVVRKRDFCNGSSASGLLRFTCKNHVSLPREFQKSLKNSRFFITGTDTGIGKTYVTTKLLTEFNQAGFTTLGLKPIATGAIMSKEGLLNEDARRLQEAASIKIPLNEVNPFVFAPAIAPHLAAKESGASLSAKQIAETMTETMRRYPADYYLIEGAGGIAVPLNETELMADLILMLEMPLILVVGIRLGCLNHAILSYELIKQLRLPFAGWVANCLDPACMEKDELIETLRKKMGEPCLWRVPAASCGE